MKNTSEVGSPEVVNKFLEESPKIKLRHLLALMVRGVCVCTELLVVVHIYICELK